VATLRHERTHRDRGAAIERHGERLRERLTAFVACAGILREAAVDCLCQARRHVGRDACKRGRWIGHVARQDRDVIRALEGKPARKDEEPHDAERIEITPGIDRSAGRLLWAHEPRGSHHALGTGGRSRAHASDPEVRHERPTGGPLEQDVIGLHIPMDHTAGVGMRQGARHFLEDSRGGGVPQRAAIAHALSQRLAVDVGHHEEHEVLDLVHGEDGDDPRVGELCRGARLPQEALPGGRLAGPFGRQQLDRHPAVEPQIAREVYDPHTAASETALQRVSPSQRTSEFGRNRVSRHGA
jgi:hypothetical protein